MVLHFRWFQLQIDVCVKITNICAIDYIFWLLCLIGNISFWLV
jgi:hypothetical protein